MTLAPPILPVPRERLGPAPSPRRSTGNRGAGMLLAVGVLFGLTLAWSLLAHWAGEYAQPDSYYAYGPLIPFLAALMLWRRRERLPRARPCLGALAALLPATGLLVVATKLQMPALMSLGFLGAVWSSAWLLRGTAWVRAARVPLLFLLWMAPLPGPLLNDATFDAQGWSTRLADGALHVLSFHTTLSGSVIALDTFSLFVDVPCSGLKGLLTLVMFGSAFAVLADGPARRRLSLVLVSAPLAVFVNVARLVTLALVGECFGSHAEHLIHDASGLGSVALGFFLLMAFARRIGCHTLAGWRLFSPPPSSLPPCSP